MPAPIPRMLSWPLGGIAEDGRLAWSSDELSVREVILNILLTRPGERLQRPDFGAGLLNFVHQPNNETTRHLIKGVVQKALRNTEPRIVVEAVEVQASPDSVADVHISVRYRLRHSATPSDLGLTLTLGTQN